MITFFGQPPCEAASWNSRQRAHSGRFGFGNCHSQLHNGPFRRGPSQNGPSQNGPFGRHSCRTPEEHYSHVPFFLLPGSSHINGPAHFGRGNRNPWFFPDTPPNEQNAPEVKPVVREVESEDGFQIRIFKNGGFEGYELKVVRTRKDYILKVESPEGFCRKYPIDAEVYDIEEIDWEGFPEESVLVISIPKRRSAVGQKSREEKERAREVRGKTKEERRQAREQRRQAKRDRRLFKRQERQRNRARKQEEGPDPQGFLGTESEATTPSESEGSTDEEARGARKGSRRGTSLEARRGPYLEEIEDEEFITLRKNLTMC